MRFHAPALVMDSTVTQNVFNSSREQVEIWQQYENTIARKQTCEGAHLQKGLYAKKFWLVQNLLQLPVVDVGCPIGLTCLHFPMA